MKLPVISGMKLVKILVNKLNFRIKHRKGSHIYLEGNYRGEVKKICVPDHPELSKGVLLTILKQLDLSREELYRLLEDP